MKKRNLPLVQVIWNLDGELDGNVAHIAEHDITKEEVEQVVLDPSSRTQRSRKSGLPITFGWTSTGRYIAVIWEEVCDDPRIINPVTAYEPDEDPLYERRRR